MHRETEAALPLARAGDALAALVDVVEQTRVRVNVIAELRFVRGDTGWMSPAHGGDAVREYLIEEHALPVSYSQVREGE